MTAGDQGVLFNLSMSVIVNGVVTLFPLTGSTCTFFAAPGYPIVNAPLAVNGAAMTVDPATGLFATYKSTGIDILIGGNWKIWFQTIGPAGSFTSPPSQIYVNAAPI